MIYNVPVRTLNQTKPTILQCRATSKDSGQSVHDPLYKARFLHTVRSAKGLIRMCCCSRTVYPTLDNLAVEGKYDQQMLLSECAVAQTDPSLRSLHKMFC